MIDCSLCTKKLLISAVKDKLMFIHEVDKDLEEQLALSVLSELGFTIVERSLHLDSKSIEIRILKNRELKQEYIKAYMELM